MKIFYSFLFATMLLSTSSIAQWNGNNTTSGKASIGANLNPFPFDKVRIYNNDNYTSLKIETLFDGSPNSTYGIYSTISSVENSLSSQRYGIYSRTNNNKDWAIYSKGKTGIAGDLERMNETTGNHWVNHLGYTSSDYSYKITPRDGDGIGLFNRSFILRRSGEMVKNIDKAEAEAFAIRKAGVNEFVVMGDGDVFARSLRVTLGSIPDYVFESDYDLMPIEEVSDYVNRYKHLPNIPSEKEIIKNGLDVGEMQAKQLEKIEELTLYIIEIHKRIKKIEKENRNLQKKLDTYQISIKE